jgi:hypothetical protein
MLFSEIAYRQLHRHPLLDIPAKHNGVISCISGKALPYLHVLMHNLLVTVETTKRWRTFNALTHPTACILVASPSQ